jgi:hypothetical protein
LLPAEGGWLLRCARLRGSCSAIPASSLFRRRQFAKRFERPPDRLHFVHFPFAKCIPGGHVGAPGRAALALAGGCIACGAGRGGCAACGGCLGGCIACGAGRGGCAACGGCLGGCIACGVGVGGRAACGGRLGGCAIACGVGAAGCEGRCPGGGLIARFLFERVGMAPGAGGVGLVERSASGAKGCAPGEVVWPGTADTDDDSGCPRPGFAFRLRCGCAWFPCAGAADVEAGIRWPLAPGKDGPVEGLRPTAGCKVD